MRAFPYLLGNETPGLEPVLGGPLHQPDQQRGLPAPGPPPDQDVIRHLPPQSSAAAASIGGP